jgi:hypothetical protein
MAKIIRKTPFIFEDSDLEILNSYLKRFIDLIVLNIDDIRLTEN